MFVCGVVYLCARDVCVYAYTYMCRLYIYMCLYKSSKDMCVLFVCIDFVMCVLGCCVCVLLFVVVCYIDCIHIQSMICCLHSV